MCSSRRHACAAHALYFAFCECSLEGLSGLQAILGHCECLPFSFPLGLLSQCMLMMHSNAMRQFILVSRSPALREVRASYCPQ